MMATETLLSFSIHSCIVVELSLFFCLYYILLGAHTYTRSWVKFAVKCFVEEMA